MRRVAVLLLVTLTLVACKGDSNKHAFPTTTSTTAAATTSSTASSTTTTALAAAAPAPNGCDANALTRVAPRDDRTKYVVSAHVGLDANVVDGYLTATFKPDAPTDRIVMRLWPNGPTPASHGGRANLDAASLDGKPVALSLDNPTTAVAGTGPLTAGRAYEFKVHFADTMPRDLDDRFSRVGNTVRLGSWLPLLPWEPGVGWALDPPTTSNAEASLSAAADFDVRIVPPANATVLATGEQVEPLHWVARAVPDWAASVGSFNVVEGTAAGAHVTVGVEKSMGESPAAYLSRVTAALTDLSRRYGAYPYPTFTLALTPNLKGGIEYPGHVMQGPNTNARTTPHEVAHQWFYSLVGNDQGRDPWLDEGMASWAEAQTNHSYASFLSKSIPADGRNRIGEAMPYWDQRHSSYYRSVYVQSVQALGALGVSTAAVDCALARYVAANAYRVATPHALADALKTVAPNAPAVLQRYGAQRVSG